MKSRKQRIHKKKTFRNRGLNRKTLSKTQLRKRNKSRKMKGSGFFSRLNTPTKELFEHFYKKKKDINLTNDELIELIGKGADINAKDRDKMTPLLLATYYNNFEISKLLVERNVKIDERNINGDTALSFAIVNNNFEICELLINSGADVNARGVDKLFGFSFTRNDAPLLVATFNNKNVEICKLLIDRGADVNVNSDYNDTPLLWATKNNNYEICELLINKGADVNAMNMYKTTPLQYATHMNYTEIIDLLKNETTVMNPLHDTHTQLDTTPNMVLE